MRKQKVNRMIGRAATVSPMGVGTRNGALAQKAIRGAEKALREYGGVFERLAAYDKT